MRQRHQLDTFTSDMVAGFAVAFPLVVEIVECTGAIWPAVDIPRPPVLLIHSAVTEGIFKQQYHAWRADTTIGWGSTTVWRLPTIGRESTIWRLDWLRWQRAVRHREPAPPPRCSPSPSTVFWWFNRNGRVSRNVRHAWWA